MLCRGCRRRLSRGASVCDSCGEPLPGAEAPLELVLAGGDRVPLVGDILIGRAAGCTLQLADPSVSRRHARISAGNGAPARIEDAGSSHGTYLDGRRLTGPTALHDGVRIELGDQELVVERRRGESEAGRTIVVRPGASLVVPALGAPGPGQRDRVRAAPAGPLAATRSSGSTRTRAGAGGCCATSSATTSCACRTTTPSCSSCSTARATCAT